MQNIELKQLAEWMDFPLPEQENEHPQNDEDLKEWINAELSKKQELKSAELQVQLKNIALENNILKPEIEKLKLELISRENEFKSKMESLQLNYLLEQEKSKLIFKEDIGALEKIGFEKLLQENYLFQLNEDHILEIKDKTGKSIFMPGKSKQASVLEVFTSLARDNKLLKETQPKTVVVSTIHKERVLHPRARV